MNRIDKLFKEKQKNILSVYFTAGFPKFEDTVKIITELEANGVDMVEIGMPFSDPLADGPVIQQSSHIALNNGMSIRHMFEQLKGIREHVSIPLVLMGYINPIMYFGVEEFCDKCAEVGIDGVILPDMPVDVFKNDFKKYFEDNNIHNIFLISPQTTEKRIRELDNAASGFIYMVSSSSTTGERRAIENTQIDYFERIAAMKLTNPRMIGFGISDNSTFTRACQYANGAIIGSAFINALSAKGDLSELIRDFVKRIRGINAEEIQEFYILDIINEKIIPVSEKDEFILRTLYALGEDTWMMQRTTVIASENGKSVWKCSNLPKAHEILESNTKQESEF